MTFNEFVLSILWKYVKARGSMKIFDVDVAFKYIGFRMNGHQYTVQFRENKRKGIYDIKVLEDGKV